MSKVNAVNYVNLRLLINKETGKILYAEGGKDFVDLLFSFLTLPAGSIIKLLSAVGSSKNVACLTNLYKSVKKLQPVFMNANKSHLLNPQVMTRYSSDLLRIQAPPTTYYVCNLLYYCNAREHYVTTQSGGLCACGQSLTTPVSMQTPSKVDENQGKGGAKGNKEGSASSGEGYVKETVTFIITDQLEISPISTITSIALLNKLNVKDLAELEERTRRVGPNEALELLLASLVSTSALNDVFGPRITITPRQKAVWYRTTTKLLCTLLVRFIKFLLLKFWKPTYSCAIMREASAL